ncbi:rhodanese-like domain-containing protein [Alkalibacillus salilacus]|uniref:Rhodanese-related sulfurtransferase n=1 Tax=Alkalibacillus salilacus TaxID=284582 RepID=A0ABT9VBR5_9BACI|nr:rhodanese-like domain-containing protein [Alkalibacillus salilacus]MDQ0158411.1 rhodanese-related sulfurtransferase [Alkalibacillus salilacus]
MNEITTDEVKQLLENKEDVNLLDVREPEEIEQGHIPGIKHIPLGSLEERKDELSQDQEHVVICRSGNRSGKAVQYLEQHGFNAKNMVGGMLDWNGPVKQS